MAALQRDVVLTSRGLAQESAAFVVKHGSTIYAGGLVGVDSTGYLAPWADVAGMRLAGIALAPATGNTSANPPVLCRVAIGATIEGVTFADCSQDDALAALYCSSDNLADLQTDVGSNTGPVALLMNFRSGETGDVRILTPAEYAAATLP